MRSGTKQAVSIDGIIQMLVNIGDLIVRVWFGVVENHAVDVLLDTALIDLCIRDVFQSELP